LLSGEDDFELLSEERAELSDDAPELSEEADNEHPAAEARTVMRSTGIQAFMSP